MNKNYRIFLDFDGTITANDVGYELFKTFTFRNTESLAQVYWRGEINSLQCLTGECTIWNEYAPSSHDVYSFLDHQDITPGFREFLVALDNLELSPVILSEGFDFYIDRFLSFRDLAHLKRITNVASFQDGILKPQFPYYQRVVDSALIVRATIYKK